MTKTERCSAHVNDSAPHFSMQNPGAQTERGRKMQSDDTAKDDEKLSKCQCARVSCAAAVRSNPTLCSSIKRFIGGSAAVNGL